MLQFGHEADILTTFSPSSPQYVSATASYSKASYEDYGVYSSGGWQYTCSATITALRPGTQTVTFKMSNAGSEGVPGYTIGSTKYVVNVTVNGNTSVTDISGCTMTLPNTSYEYNGLEQKPVPTIKKGSTKLTEGTDYTLTYSNNKNVGTATVKATGKGSYTGTLSKSFSITQATPTVTLTQKDASYTGEPISIGAATVTGVNGETPSGSLSYTYYTSYTNATTNQKTTASNGATTTGGAPSKKGTYYVVATFTATTGGNYKNATSNVATLEITGKNISDLIILINPIEYVYDGEYKEPTVSVYDDSVLIVSFDANGGACSTSTKAVNKGALYGTLPVPDRNGFTFNGWYDAQTGGNKILDTTIVTKTGNHTLYAQWTIATVSPVTSLVDGGEYVIASINYSKAYGNDYNQTDAGPTWPNSSNPFFSDVTIIDGELDPTSVTNNKLIWIARSVSGGIILYNKGLEYDTGSGSTVNPRLFIFTIDDDNEEPEWSVLRTTTNSYPNHYITRGSGYWQINGEVQIPLIWRTDSPVMYTEFDGYVGALPEHENAVIYRVK